jgi:hypothetical protein
MRGLTLDAVALIAFERNDRRLVGLIVRALDNGCALAVPATVVGQIWRDGRRQTRLARLLGSEAVEIEPPRRPASPRDGAIVRASRYRRRDRRLRSPVRPRPGPPHRNE